MTNIRAQDYFYHLSNTVDTQTKTHVIIQLHPLLQALIADKNIMVKLFNSIYKQVRLKIREYFIQNAITKPTLKSIKHLIINYYIKIYLFIWRLRIQFLNFEKNKYIYPIKKLDSENTEGMQKDNISCWTLDKSNIYLIHVAEELHKISKHWSLVTRSSVDFLNCMICCYDPVNYIIACNKLYHRKINKPHIIYTDNNGQLHDHSFDQKNNHHEINIFLSQMYSRIDYRISKIQKKFYRFPESSITSRDALDLRQNYKLENLDLSHELFNNIEDENLGKPSRIKHQIQFDYMNKTFCIGNPRWDKAYSICSKSDAIFGRVGRIHVSVFDNKTQYRDNYAIKHEDIIEFVGHSSGAEDCRVLQTDSGPIIVFNALTHLGHRRIFIHDITEKKTSMLWNADSKMVKVEKNWTPYFNGTDIILVYSHVPNQIMRLKSLDTGECEILYNNNNQELSKPRSIYGGSNIIPWSPTTNLTFAHSRGPWQAIPLLLDDQCKIIKIGKKLNFKLADLLGLKIVKKGVEFPYFLNISEDKIELFLEVEDCASAKLTFSPESFAKGLISARL